MIKMENETANVLDATVKKNKIDRQLIGLIIFVAIIMVVMTLKHCCSKLVEVVMRQFLRLNKQRWCAINANHAGML